MYHLQKSICRHVDKTRLYNNQAPNFLPITKTVNNLFEKGQIQISSISSICENGLSLLELYFQQKRLQRLKLNATPVMKFTIHWKITYLRMYR